MTGKGIGYVGGFPINTLFLAAPRCNDPLSLQDVGNSLSGFALHESRSRSLKGNILLNLHKLSSV